MQLQQKNLLILEGLLNREGLWVSATLEATGLGLCALQSGVWGVRVSLDSADPLGLTVPERDAAAGCQPPVLLAVWE